MRVSRPTGSLPWLYGEGGRGIADRTIRGRVALVGLSILDKLQLTLVGGLQLCHSLGGLRNREREMLQSSHMMVM